MADGAAGRKFAFGLGVVAAALLAGLYVWQLSGQFGGVQAPSARPVASVAATPSGAAPAGAAPSADALPGSPGASARLDFEPGSDRLPAATQQTLDRIAESARTNGGGLIEISAYYPAGADAAGAKELASRRLQAVRHALEANGVASARLRGGVGAAPADADPREAGRVEVTSP
jgi:outer membrane protein OmpA-like peptidoglycan-associated protein